MAARVAGGGAYPDVTRQFAEVDGRPPGKRMSGWDYRVHHVGEQVNAVVARVLTGRRARVIDRDRDLDLARVELVKRLLRVPFADHDGQARAILAEPGDPGGAGRSLVCSAGAFSILVALVAEIGPVRTTTVTYVNPAVALVAGAVVLGEPITAWSVLGFALILAGCVLAASRRQASPAPQASPAVDVSSAAGGSPAPGASPAPPASPAPGVRPADGGVLRQAGGLLSALRYRVAAGDRSSLHGGASGRWGAA